MASRGRVPAAGFGLDMSSIAPMAGVAQQRLPADELEQELIRAARRVSLSRSVMALGGEQSAAGSLPQPATVQDTIALSREAREAAREQAESARELAKQEEARRKEAEAKAGGAYAAGEADATERHSITLELFKDFASESREMLQQTYEARLQAQNETHAAVLKGIDAKLDAALAAKDAEIAREKERREQAEAQAARLAGRKTASEELGEALLAGKLKEHPIIQLAQGLVPQTGAASDPNAVYQTAIAQGLAQAHVSKANLEVDKERAAIEQARSRGDKWDRLLDSAARLLEGAAGAVAPPTGMAENGVPAAFPEGEAAQ